MSYNVNRFHVDDYDFTRFDGPRAGEQALDFTLFNTQGQPVSLSDYKGKWLVLEMGAISCGMYAKNIKNNNLLSKDYPDVEFLVVYVREPHPGERTGPHKSMDEKINNAKDLRTFYGEERKVLVDSRDGDMHQAYGSMPNSVYVINPEGKVIYRCDWMVTSELKKVLDNRDHIHTTEHADMSVLDHPPIPIGVKSLLKGGWKAMWDFIKMVPRMRPLHGVVDKYYVEHGQLARSDSDHVN